MVSRQDLAALMCSLARQPPDGFHCWIVSDGEVYSTRRIYDAMRRAMGRHTGNSWWPGWLWRLACKVMDALRSGGDESSQQKLFGTELYDNSALLAARPWRPEQTLEAVVSDMLFTGDQPEEPSA